MPEPMTGDNHCDAIIIGAGQAGLTAGKINLIKI